MIQTFDSFLSLVVSCQELAENGRIAEANDDERKEVESETVEDRVGQIEQC